MKNHYLEEVLIGIGTVAVCFFFVAALASVLFGCGKSQASLAPHFEQTNSPKPGYTCFVFLDSSGNYDFGNCVKD